jgi:hypothetical protein
MAGNLLVTILSAGPQTGKSTARTRFALELGLRGTSTSNVIAAVLEQERGLAPGTVEADRELDHERWRSELREVGDRIGAGPAPAIVRAIDAGYRVIDGCRRVAELDAGLQRAAELGLTPVVVWIGGRTGDAPRGGGDNTEASLLRERATLVIQNDGTLADLEREVATQAAALGASG